MTLPVIPMVGVNFGRRTDTQEYTLGTAQIGDNNKTYVYVLAPAACSSTVTLAADFTITNTAGDYTVADGVSFTAGQYGWIFKTTSPL